MPHSRLASKTTAMWAEPVRKALGECEAGYLIFCAGSNVCFRLTLCINTVRRYVQREFGTVVSTVTNERKKTRQYKGASLDIMMMITFELHKAT
jgi:hypothetical protein